MAELIPTYSARSTVSSLNCERPPAKRRKAVGPVHFCSEKEKQQFASRGWIDEEQSKPETQVVNLHVFRNYLLNYLKNHPRTHKELMIMVRQMQPTAEGLPLEIYCFTNTTVWPEYEQIQGEIFDHILAVIPEFGLRIFQRPSGNDLTNIAPL